MTLVRFPKKRYILINQGANSSSGSESGSSSERPWKSQGFWDGGSNLFPELGKLGDSVKEGYTWENLSVTTTLLGPDGGVIPQYATIRALTDEPGQTLSNWKIQY
jgi:hypothetical protein